MDVHLSEEQSLLQESARDFLEAECPMDFVRTRMEEPPGGSDGLWQKMSQLGWTGISLPDAYGGAGMDLLSLSLLCQEMGRVLLPSPYLSTVALGAQAVLHGGSDAIKQRVLPGVAEGSNRIALALLEEGLVWSPGGIAMEAVAGAGRYRLNGNKTFTTDAGNANLLLVPARTSSAERDGITLFLVDVEQTGVECEPIGYTDQTRNVSDVSFANVDVSADNIVGEVDRGWEVVERALDYAKVALCGEMLGGAERMLEMSVEYAGSREQFGKPIGSFQAIQHKCANQFMNVESIRSALFYAAWSVGNDEPDAHVSACLAKSFCGEAFTAVAAEGIQIHGGLGFTWEQDLHLYYKRAKANEMLFGDGDWNRELAAAGLLD